MPGIAAGGGGRAGETWPVWAPGRDAHGAGQSLSRLEVGPLTFLVVVPTRCAGLGDPVDRVGSGQAQLGGPALDGGPEPVPFAEAGFAGEVSQGHGGDGGVAIKDPAGQPGHLPEVLTPGRLAGGVSSLVAGHYTAPSTGWPSAFAAIR